MEEKVSYQEALQNAQNEVVKLGEKLRAQFQKHTVSYYIEEIIQVSRRQKVKKDVGPWNAFVSMEVKRINAGQ